MKNGRKDQNRLQGPCNKGTNYKKKSNGWSVPQKWLPFNQIVIIKFRKDPKLDIYGITPFTAGPRVAGKIFLWLFYKNIQSTVVNSESVNSIGIRTFPIGTRPIAQSRPSPIPAIPGPSRASFNVLVYYLPEDVLLQRAIFFGEFRTFSKAESSPLKSRWFYGLWTKNSFLEAHVFCAILQTVVRTLGTWSFCWICAILRALTSL